MLHVILGGAAIYRCGNCPVFNAALAAAVALSMRERVSPRPAKRKNSMLHLILGGAAIYRCGNCPVFNAALAAAVALSMRERVSPRPAKAQTPFGL
jgi:hypothetical protein